MSSEQNLSESPAYQDYAPAQITGPNSNGTEGSHQSAPGMGQSKSSRRRRRKRKNKLAASGSDTPVQNGAQFNGDIQAGGHSYAAPSPVPQQGYSGGQQQAGQGGGKRWKKKFRDRQRGGDNIGNQAGGYSNGNGVAYRDKDTHQPGNNAMGGHKRKSKQRDRGPRSFVGPMDHSYRGVNGNFADGPAATIDTFGGRGGGGGRAYVSDSQPIDYSVGRPIPIPDDAPTRIYFFIEDLFFNAKINETARKLGVKVGFIKGEKTEKDVLAELMAGDEVPGLIVFDLNNANAKPLTLIPKLKSKLKGASVIGFLQHIQGELKAKAVEAGCDTVMPRAAFSQNLPNLLRRYGTQEEEDDTNYNQ